MLLSRVLGGVGRVLITAGVLILLFVAYQLWGTGLQTRAAQNSLENEFEAKLAEVEATQASLGIEPVTTSTTSTTATTSTTEKSGSDSGTDTPSTTPTTSAPPTTAAGPTTTVVPYIPELPSTGEAVAQLDIPDIGLDWLVVEGVGVPELKEGPGHYPGTPLPGQQGNAAIAGHRTTYGAPFYRINELEAGDPVYVRTVQGQFEYRVRESLIVDPSEYARVINEPEGDLLTLTSCHPRFSAAERYIVHAELIGEAQPGPTPEQLAERDTDGFGAPDQPNTNDSSNGDTPAGGSDGDSTDADTDTDGASDADADDADAHDGIAGVADADGSDVGGGEGVGERAAAQTAVADGLSLDENDGAWKQLDAWGPVLPWALLAGATWFAAWLLGRQWRRLPSYAMGLPIFALFLFMFFEKFSLLLPAAY